MTKETKDLGAAPPRSPTDAKLHELEEALRAAPGEMAKAELFERIHHLRALSKGRMTTFGPLLREIRLSVALPARRLARTLGISHVYLGEVERGRRGAMRKRLDAVVAALRAAGVPEPRLAELREAGDRCPTCGGRPGNADASPPPDSSAALLEARRLLGQIAQPKPSVDMADTPEDQLHDALHELALIRERARAFLRSDSERSEHGKG